MPRNKPTLTHLNELAPGQLADFFALLADKTKGLTRGGKPYYNCRFRDAKRTASWMVWADNERYDECDKHWQPGQFFKLRATFADNKQYGPQLDVHNIRLTTDADRESGFQEADFVERSRFDSSVMFAELRGLAESNIQDESFRKLVLVLLDGNAEVLKLLPGSQRHYYPFPGGWLEHTLSVVHSCLWLSQRYQKHYPELSPPLNRDLIIASATLHEIGRIRELTPGNELGSQATPTIPGRLFGHLYLGRDMVRESAREIPALNPQLLQLLEHILISYLMDADWGSPRSPMIPEVLVLHHAADLDCKMEMYVRCLRKDVAEGPFTERDPMMGKRLLKEREV